MSTNPYAPPKADVADTDDGVVRYAGFWRRVAASLLDTLMLLCISMPLLYAIYGERYFDDESPMVHGAADFLLSWVAPAIASVVFWLTRQATPGKMLMSARVVDARTGGPLRPLQAIGRYLGYYVSTLPLGLGLLWVAFDAKKQGWHDKLAGTVVVVGPRPPSA